MHVYTKVIVSNKPSVRVHDNHTTFEFRFFRGRRRVVSRHSSETQVPIVYMYILHSHIKSPPTLNYRITPQSVLYRTFFNNQFNNYYMPISITIMYYKI